MRCSITFPGIEVRLAALDPPLCLFWKVGWRLLSFSSQAPLLSPCSYSWLSGLWVCTAKSHWASCPPSLSNPSPHGCLQPIFHPAWTCPWDCPDPATGPRTWPCWTEWCSHGLSPQACQGPSEWSLTYYKRLSGQLCSRLGTIFCIIQECPPAKHGQFRRLIKGYDDPVKRGFPNSVPASATSRKFSFWFHNSSAMLGLFIVLHSVVSNLLYNISQHITLHVVMYTSKSDSRRGKVIWIWLHYIFLASGAAHWNSPQLQKLE